MRIPAGQGKEIYLRGENRPGDFSLQPGEVAFVTSAEEFCLPEDVAGNIGIRFQFVNQGLLVHTGLLIDPGFGLTHPPNKRQRLHFLIVNISLEAQKIKPGDQIVSLQFFEVLGTAEMGAPPKGQELLEDQYLEENRPLGLSLLTELRKVEEVESRLTRLEETNFQVILFGVYVVAAALIGVAMAQLLAFLGGDSSRVKSVRDGLHTLDANWRDLVLVLAAAAALTFLLAVILYGIGKFFGFIGVIITSRFRRR